MIEGSRIDMAGHSNDPAGHVHEILSYQSTIKAVRQHVDELNAAGSTTVMISVSDHETGGLSLGYQLPGLVYPEYAWYPDALTNATRTSVKVARQINAQAATIDIEDIRRLLKDELGVSDPSDAELNGVIAQKDDTTLWFLDHVLSRLTSARAQVGWSTEGHSGVGERRGYLRSARELTRSYRRQSVWISPGIGCSDFGRESREYGGKCSPFEIASPQLICLCRSEPTLQI